MPRSAVSRKSPSSGPSGSTASTTLALFHRGHGGLQDVGRVVHRLVQGDAGQQIALFGRAQNHDLAAQVAAQPSQIAQVAGGRGSDLGIGTGQVVAFGERQQPMQADDFQPRRFGLLADFPPPAGR
jgi:hypothetical protein